MKLLDREENGDETWLILDDYYKRHSDGSWWILKVIKWVRSKREGELESRRLAILEATTNRERERKDEVRRQIR
jgi:hypothetical protein